MPATSVMAHERHIPNRNGSLRCALFAAKNIPSTGPIRGHALSAAVIALSACRIKRRAIAAALSALSPAWPHAACGDNRTERMSY